MQYQASSASYVSAVVLLRKVCSLFDARNTRPNWVKEMDTNLQNQVLPSVAQSESIPREMQQHHLPKFDDNSEKAERKLRPSILALEALEEGTECKR
jgi:hypothetical protein